MKKTNECCEFLTENGCRIISEARELKIIQKLTKLISESEDFNSALKIIMKTLCETINSPYAETWIPQHHTNTLRCYSIWSEKDINQNQIKDLNKNISDPKDKSLQLRIFSSTKPEWLTDVNPEDTCLKNTNVKTAFGVPVITDNKVQLILIFYLNKIMKEDKNLLTLISTIATQLSWVLKHKEFEDRLKNSFQRTMSGRAIINIDGKFIEVNKALSNILGYSEKQLLGKTFQELLDNNGLDYYIINIQNLLSKNISVFNSEIKLYTKKKNAVWGQVEIEIIFNSFDIPLYFNVQINDITNSKLLNQNNEYLKQELIKANSKVKTLSSLLPMCAWCKRIRVEDGNWYEIEEFLEKYSDIKLTHGICNTCAKKVTKKKYK